MKTRTTWGEPFKGKEFSIFLRSCPFCGWSGMGMNAVNHVVGCNLSEGFNPETPYGQNCIIICCPNCNQMFCDDVDDVGVRQFQKLCPNWPDEPEEDEKPA